jgi:hypothetical protein
MGFRRPTAASNADACQVTRQHGFGPLSVSRMLLTAQGCGLPQVGVIVAQNEE